VFVVSAEAQKQLIYAAILNSTSWYNLCTAAET
jgi:hypothetical protein